MVNIPRKLGPKALIKVTGSLRKKILDTELIRCIFYSYLHLNVAQLTMIQYSSTGKRLENLTLPYLEHNLPNPELMSALLTRKRISRTPVREKNLSYAPVCPVAELVEETSGMSTLKQLSLPMKLLSKQPLFDSRRCC
jgi:hypothetical protein